MYVWLVCFVVLFGLAELYPWVQGVVLPFPVMLLAGVGLAIASNLNPQNRLAERATPAAAPPQMPPPASPSTVVDPAIETSAIENKTESLPPAPPHRSALSAPSDTISFTIRKPGSNRSS